jgi:hypothetical protein
MNFVALAESCTPRLGGALLFARRLARRFARCAPGAGDVSAGTKIVVLGEASRTEMELMHLTLNHRSVTAT